MRVCVWNVRRATSASPVWQLLTQLAPDIALLQEVISLPDTLTAQYRCVLRRAAGKTGRPQRFGTAILARGELAEPIPLVSQWAWVNEELGRFSGNLVAHTVTLSEGRTYRVMSIYSPAWPVDRSRLVGVDVQAIKLRQNPDVWVTELAWAALREIVTTTDPPLIVGGDLNSSETFDDLWPNGPHGNREVLERMRALGLTECLRHANNRIVPTFRNPRDGKVIHQMDHLFVSAQLARRLRSCITGDPTRVFGDSLSDHLPAVADFQDS